MRVRLHIPSILQDVQPLYAYYFERDILPQNIRCRLFSEGYSLYFFLPKIRVNIFLSCLHLNTFFFQLLFLYMICIMTLYFGLIFCAFASWAYIGKLLLDQGYDLGVFGSDYLRLGIFSNIWKVFLINSKNHFLNLKTHFKWFLSYNLINIYFSNFFIL